MRTQKFLKSYFSILVFLVSLLFNTAPKLLAQALLDPVTHPKFVNSLPIPAKINGTRGGTYSMEMKETVQWLGLVDVNNNNQQLMTTVWGYGMLGKGVSYPGPTIWAKKDVQLKIKWLNNLPSSYNFPYGLNAHLFPVDVNLHMARPTKGGIPVVAHLHGGHTESASDGLPEAWFTQGYKEKGAEYVKNLYTYDNSQEAATIWYHDHALGITRLNVYAGLAGFYLVRDDNEVGLVLNNTLPSPSYDIEIAIQDRMFTSVGQLYRPSEADPIEFPGAPSPSIIAEFFGDFIVVNGVVWPKLDVEPRKYRFRFLNGSDSRFYILKLSNGQQFYQIGTDDGLLPYPVPLTSFVFAPGERAELIIDFSGKAGQNIILENLGPDEPFQGTDEDQDPADPATTGMIMMFSVNKPLSSTPDATVDLGTRLRPDIAPLSQTGATRQLVLFEGEDQFGRLRPQLGTLADGSLLWDEPITENPMLNDVEVWEVYNATMDAHPIHLHLVSFQILNREEFDGEPVVVGTDPMEGGTKQVLQVNSLSGVTEPPAAHEAGWKDTAIMLPGQITRVIAKFDREGRYVWHCHILSHEDHEMMRPYQVGPIPPLAKRGSDSNPNITLVDNVPSSFGLDQNYPNPFNPETRIRFQLPETEQVVVKIFNITGEEIATLINRQYGSGVYEVVWNGRDSFGNQVASGVYFYQIEAGKFSEIKKMTLIR